ncbi:MAG TPA: hypothetical protein VJ781_03180 [Pyrinomonadaceae bacterium]|jgi:hypothetical protein|nr:hypothetical protein [Pyrinomonadaceae bacterium]
MKIVKKFLFMLFVVAGLAFAVSAQKNDPKKPPKNPPTVDPGKKKPPKENPPPRDSKPKKPGMAYVVVDGRIWEGD